MLLKATVQFGGRADVMAAAIAPESVTTQETDVRIAEHRIPAAASRQGASQFFSSVEGGEREKQVPAVLGQTPDPRCAIADEQWLGSNWDRNKNRNQNSELGLAASVEKVRA